MKKIHNLQENYLNILRTEKIIVNIYLINGIKLIGLITNFDNFCIVLKNNQINQMIYKHAISTIVPSKFVLFYDEKENEK